jgi:hypothetical protein
MLDVGRIRGFAVMGDSTLALLDGTPPFIKLYRQSDAAMLHQFGELGDGPGEMRDPHHLTVSWSAPAGAWELRAYEPNMRRLTHWQFADSLRFVERVLLEGLKVENVIVTANELFGSPLVATSGPLIRADGLSFARDAALGMAPYRPDDFSPVMVFDANRHAVAVGGGPGRIAAAYLFASEVQLINTSDGTVTRWFHPQARSAPVPDEWPNPGFSVDSSTISFVAVGGSRAGVVAAYCGCLGAKLGHHAIELIMLDWSGRPQGSVMVAGGVKGVDLTEDGSGIWVAYNDPEPHAILVTSPRSNAISP